MKLGQPFADRPIHDKLNLINLLVVMVALVPLVCISLSYEYYSVRHSMQQEAEVQADIIRDNVAAATAFGDAESAYEILMALRSSPHVVQAVVFLPNGAELARYAVSGQEIEPIPFRSALQGSFVDWQRIRVFRVVSLKSNVVGWLAVETSMQPLLERFSLYLTVIVLSTVLGFAIAYPFSTRLKDSITRPLSELMELAQHVMYHHDYSPPKRVNSSNDEIGSLSRAFDDMLSRIRERDAKLSQMAYFDNVTGLYNRHYFMERLEQAVANSLRYGQVCCLMFIDLDNFKTVNDTYGHHVGDDLLREVAMHLTRVLRDNDIVCRLGGDEFAIILENTRSMVGPSVMAQKIIEDLCRPMTLHGSIVRIGASVGISACPDNSTTTADLLRTADAAMYQAKEAGKNCYRLYQAVDTGVTPTAHKPEPQTRQEQEDSA